jgi:hypothetical protein
VHAREGMGANEAARLADPPRKIDVLLPAIERQLFVKADGADSFAPEGILQP